MLGCPLLEVPQGLIVAQDSGFASVPCGEAVRSATRCTSEQVVSAALATACVLACEWDPPLCAAFVSS